MDHTEPLDEVIAAYLEADRRGAAPSAQELIATYPTLAADLRTFLADRERFRRTADTIPPVPFARLDPARYSSSDLSGTVGGYEVVGELGKGGMGVVYKARQPSLRRLVALKMVLHGGEAERERFRAEAQAVARLQHPNIVQVYEVGEHGGRPFFSLEYVDGGSLAQRIKGEPQPTRQAAALVETLARAMDYAHRQGIVHRDLKPANVLLTAHGMPKITDFGLAKRLEEDGNTKTGAVLGTPSYIAPEQAAGKKDVGPAADIYALGAILYEMLAGRPPFRGESPMDTMLQVMTAELTSPGQLNPRVPRDLETICVKCLSKDPNRRYGSALALATDLRRFLSGESILARPAGNIERLARWCRRRPQVAVPLAALLLLTVAGIAGVVWQWRVAEANLRTENQLRAEAVAERKRAEAAVVEARQERDRAEKERQRAEENFRQARNAVDDYLAKVDENVPLKQQPSLRQLRKELLESALRYYLDFVKKHRDKPELRQALASAYYRVGLITNEIGSRTDALAAFREARSLYQQLLPANGGDTSLRLGSGATDVAIGRLEKQMDRLDDSLRSYQRAVAAFEAVHRVEPKLDRAVENLAFAYMDLSSLYAGMGQSGEAVRNLEQARTRLEGLEPTRLRRRMLSVCYRNLARQYVERKQPTDAVPLALRAIALAEQLVSQPNSDASDRQVLAAGHSGLAYLHLSLGQHDKALAAFQQCRDILDKVHRENPTVVQYREELAEALHNVGVAQIVLKHPGDALTTLRRSRELFEQLAKEHPTVPVYTERLAHVLGALGEAHADAGQTEQAARHYEQARAVWEQLARANPQNDRYRLAVESARGRLKPGPGSGGAK